MGLISFFSQLCACLLLYIRRRDRVGKSSEVDSMEEPPSPAMVPEKNTRAVPRWKRLLGKASPSGSEDDSYRSKSTLGILSDKETDEVPGEQSPYWSRYADCQPGRAAEADCDLTSLYRDGLAVVIRPKRAPGDETPTSTDVDIVASLFSTPLSIFLSIGRTSKETNGQWADCA